MAQGLQGLGRESDSGMHLSKLAVSSVNVAAPPGVERLVMFHVLLNSMADEVAN